MKIFYTLLIMTLSNTVFAQTYIPIPESNAVWIQGSFLYSAYNGHEHATITQPLSFSNDSVIGGTVYHTLHGHEIADWIDGWGNQQNYQSGTDYLPDAPRVLFRQDIPNKRVYQWDIYNNQEAILYDFSNMVVGQPYPQTLNNESYPDLLVMAYDSVLLLDGLYHEKWVLGSNSTDSGFVSIIEGVGSTMGFNLPIALPFEQSSATLCFSIDGTPVFDGWANANGLIQPRFSADCSADVNVMELEATDLSVSVWPIPADDIVTITSAERIEKIAVYDLIGHLVLDQEVNNQLSVEVSLYHLPKGNYIMNVYTESGQSISKRIVR